MKYIFVTGGVVSSVGKGLAAAALGTLLEHRGLKVVLQKFDPYLNVDPGTMNPFQHGEVYVLNDGAETDLDFGHYERFTNSVLTRHNSLTSGQVYESVIAKERRGDYLGKTVQVIPHVTNEIKDRIRLVEREQPADVLITEIGGTTGDIEGLPFLEAIRQFTLEVGPRNVVVIHVTLIPFIKAAGELKTKPSQQSVARLREIGLQPQVLICRTEHELDAEIREKLSMYCNIPTGAVVEMRDVKNTIYEAPLMLQNERLDETVCDLLGLKTPPADMTDWKTFRQPGDLPEEDRQNRARRQVHRASGRLQEHLRIAHPRRRQLRLRHEAHLHRRADARSRRRGRGEPLHDFTGIVVPGGFGERGIEGKIQAAGYARTHRIPYLGLCLGMQVATIEFARNACGLEDANSTEFDLKTPFPVISLLEEQRKVADKGASMRLGVWPTHLIPGTLAEQVYGRPEIQERHRHRYEFNNDFREQMTGKGLVIAGTSPDGTLVEMIEIKDHPWFLASQFHPEFLSKPNAPHPLFRGFIGACLKHES